MKKTEPGALIAVCGCFSQLEPSEAASLGADLVGGSGDRERFALDIETAFENVERGMRNAGSSNADVTGGFCGNREAGGAGAAGTGAIQGVRTPGAFEELPPGGSAGRTRALLKIQDGCDNYCAYCVIPYARGSARSLPVARAGDFARRLDEQGYREIVITGIEISSYGKDLTDRPALTDVIREISGAAPNTRLRLGSLDPSTVTEVFCREIGDIPNFCGHFHLSLQSGCDETLSRMGRKYDAGVAKEAISLLRRRFPDCGLTADIITGFPGETDEEFAQTLGFIRSASFSDMHIFPFSPRPGTRAALMSGQIKKTVRHERARAAAAAAEESALGFRLGLIGKTVEVLFEREYGGYWCGHAGNYVEVNVKNGGAKNTVEPVLVTDVKDGAVWGAILFGEGRAPEV